MGLVAGFVFALRMVQKEAVFGVIYFIYLIDFNLFIY